ncbi:hypothetical protein IMZ48_00670 [Candidatus Bathyarchaeota archaeon]|nr:hypothetical protein [Candidatus Bathyarchaeota archaeon]
MAPTIRGYLGTFAIRFGLLSRVGDEHVALLEVVFVVVILVVNYERPVGVADELGLLVRVRGIVVLGVLDGRRRRRRRRATGRATSRIAYVYRFDLAVRSAAVEAPGSLEWWFGFSEAGRVASSAGEEAQAGGNGARVALSEVLQGSSLTRGSASASGLSRIHPPVTCRRCRPVRRSSLAVLLGKV